MASTRPTPERRATRGRRALRLALGAFRWFVLIAVTVYLVRAFDARLGPPLELWHTVSLDEEFRVGDVDETTTFAEVLAAEERLFAQLEREVYDRVEADPSGTLSRYTPGSALDPRGMSPDWNRSYELEPERLRGGALLVHGLTDSPYSLRRVAETLQSMGYYVLGVRLPGHGTIPASLAETDWRDWKAVVRLGAEHVSERVGDGLPLVLVGYSCGGALVVEYTASALLEERGPVPHTLLLFSPAIGITPFAVVSSWHRLLSWMPYFEAFRWLGQGPEYDPFKYVSFPKNGGEQSLDLTEAVQERLEQLAATPGMQRFPRTFAVQSLIDSTVLTRDISAGLYSRLPANGSELILFDMNRAAALRPFLSGGHTSLLDELRTDPARRYTLTVITNEGEDSLGVEAQVYGVGSQAPTVTSLGLSWPRGVYSLSHVAMPIPPDDPWYGDGSGSTSGQVGLELGRMQPRGERGLLRVSLDDIMRLRHNPFFAYIEERMRSKTP